ncbi:MAG: sulfotransferase [Acidobacteriaceae bacterium]|nr:sulfotransferase [Acidobacteriaceae bacterium]
MLAGSLSKAGYFMGKDLLPANRNNPKGYFETREVENLNEELIATVVPARPKFLGKWFFRERPLYTQRWLASVPVETEVSCPPSLASQIQDAVATRPYCFKDPRFCYTLPAWRPYLQNTGFVCIFRDPATTVKSIIHVTRDEDYLQSLSFSEDRAFDVWTLMYRHILENHRYEGKWLFLHYNQLFDASSRRRLEDFLHVLVDDSFPERQLSRSVSEETAPDLAKRVYGQLCGLAECDESGRSLRLAHAARA